MKRIGFFDTAKGILIILVIAGHVVQESTFRSIITSFHVPGFFMITGMLYNHSQSLQKSIYQILKKKTNKLLVPYLFFDVIYIIITTPFSGGGLSRLYNTISLNSNVGSLWYLYTAFAAELLFVLSEKMRLQKKAYRVLIVVAFVLAISLPKTRIMCIIGRILMGWLFITVGYHEYQKILSCNMRCFLVVLPILIFSSALNGTVDLWSMSLRNPALYVINALLGIYIVMFVSRLDWKYSLGYFGQNSLTLLGTHKVYLDVLRRITWYGNLTILGRCAVVVCILIAEIPVIMILNIFFPTFIGKRKQ